MSQLQTWQYCSREWKALYDEQWRPWEPVLELETGRAIHEVWRAAWHYRYENPECSVEAINLYASNHYQQWFDSELKKLGDLVPELFAEVSEKYKVMNEVTTQVMGRWLNHWDWDEWEVVELKPGVPAIECHLTCPLPGWDGFNGYIDLAARHKPQNMVWILDWKSGNTPPTNPMADLSLQLTCYQHLLGFHGVKVDGARLEWAKQGTMKPPKVNKNGTISRSSLGSCDWPTYLRAIEIHDQDPADYQDVKETLEAKQWFRTYESWRSPQEVEGVWRNVVIPAADEIRRAHLHGTIPARSWGRRPCGWCWFQHACREELEHGDAQQTMQQTLRRVRRPTDEVFTAKEIEAWSSMALVGATTPD